MPDKIFGEDFTDTTNPVGTETITIKDGVSHKDVTLQNLVYRIVFNASAEANVHDDDLIPLLDSQTAYAAKNVTFSTVATWIGTKIGAIITALTGKTTPVDADELVISDSAASNVGKKLTWANVKATLKTYFDTLYSFSDAETQTGNIYRPANSPGGTSAFSGTIATLPGGATLTYTPVSGTENAMVPQATTNLGKMRLYNTTRGTSALIENSVAGTNTITLTANVPAGWQVGDTITITSQTVSGGSVDWVDIEITSGPTTRTALILLLTITSATVGHALYVHPFETYAASKQFFSQVQSASATGINCIPLRITNGVFSMGWSGTPSALVIQEVGYLR